MAQHDDQRILNAIAVIGATQAEQGRALAQIHALVNSNLTASMRSELEATVRDVASMREVIALRRAAGHEPSQEAIAAVEATDNRIYELRASLTDKLHATDIGDAEAKG